MTADNDSESPSSQSSFSEEESRYLIHSAAEVAHILRHAAEKSTMLTAYYGRGKDDFALTSLLEVDTERDALVFETPPQPGQAARLAGSELITFVTSQDGIRIKFQVPGASATTHAGRPALESSLPAAVLRLQRREFYRIAVPRAAPVLCTVPYSVDGQDRKAEMQALDLSQEGIALMNLDQRLKLEPGSVHAGCSIVLPGIGSFEAAIEIRSCYQVTLKSGSVSIRAGCRFADLPAAGLNLVRRYTMKIERERNARFGRT